MTQKLVPFLALSAILVSSTALADSPSDACQMMQSIDFQKLLDQPMGRRPELSDSQLQRAYEMAKKVASSLNDAMNRPERFEEVRHSWQTVSCAEGSEPVTRYLYTFRGESPQCIEHAIDAVNDLFNQHPEINLPLEQYQARLNEQAEVCGDRGSVQQVSETPLPRLLEDHEEYVVTSCTPKGFWEQFGTMYSVVTPSRTPERALTIHVAGSFASRRIEACASDKSVFRGKMCFSIPQSELSNHGKITPAQVLLANQDKVGVPVIPEECLKPRVALKDAPPVTGEYLMNESITFRRRKLLDEPANQAQLEALIRAYRAK